MPHYRGGSEPQICPNPKPPQPPHNPLSPLLGAHSIRAGWDQRGCPGAVRNSQHGAAPRGEKEPASTDPCRAVRAPDAGVEETRRRCHVLPNPPGFLHRGGEGAGSTPGSSGAQPPCRHQRGRLGVPVVTRISFGFSLHPCRT